MAAARAAHRGEAALGVPTAARDPLTGAAGPVFDLVDVVAGAERGREGALAAEAASRLDAFEAAARGTCVEPGALPPARLALAVLVDQAARSNRALDLRIWSLAARRLLFDGRDEGSSRVRDLRRIAHDQGRPYEPLVAFLDGVLVRIDGVTGRPNPPLGSSSWATTVAILTAGFLVVIAAYALTLDHRFHAGLLDKFEVDIAAVDPAGATDDAAMARRLDVLRSAVAAVEREAESAPLRRLIPAIDSGRAARSIYGAAVADLLPGALHRAVAEALDVEGEGIALYDTLRARSMLDGRAEWNADYLAGWLEDRRSRLPAAGALAAHVHALEEPGPAPPSLDTVTIEQARGIAAETGLDERAYLEMRRMARGAGTPSWRPAEAVPGLGDVLFRWSREPNDAPIPGLYTRAGWDWARKEGAESALARARAVTGPLLGSAAGREKGSAEEVLRRLQVETLDRWEAYLADLRVRPLDDERTARRISAALARRDSPLKGLLWETWEQAGGSDGRRPHDLRLLVARTFGPTWTYLEKGGLAEVSALFGELNAELSKGREARDHRLMAFEDRARAVTTLEQAPPIVVRIIEDVLAQTGGAMRDSEMDALQRRWRAEVLPLCGAAAGRYPFFDGPDADLAAVEALLGPDGTLSRLMVVEIFPRLDLEQDPWRWRPDARFDGLDPESAAFFQRAHTLSSALFGADGRLGADVILAARWERGRAEVALGGEAWEVRIGAGSVNLGWPGPDPEAGIEVRFAAGEPGATLTEKGPWGLLRLLDRVPIRPRDGGRRFLVDLRTGAGRLYAEIGFEDAANPVAVRPLMQGFDCPARL